MLSFLGNKQSHSCDGTTRRDFLKIGTLGLSSIGLADLLRSKAVALSNGKSSKTMSVVWLWLGGGASHVETFDPKMNAPAEYRSITGEAKTNIPGVTIGGTLPRIGSVADRMVFIRSFTHNNAGHAGGTHWVMTGYNHAAADNGSAPIKPSMGSIVSRIRGPNNDAGIPTYVRLNGIYADGPAWLGHPYAPFDTSGRARNNMDLKIKADRLDDRQSLLHELDQMDRQIDKTGLMSGLDSFETQAFQLIKSGSKEVFNLEREDPRLRDRYGKSPLGTQLLLARRLCEAGCGFVTIHYGGWDMHSDIKRGMEKTGGNLDIAVSAFIEDLTARGMLNNVLLVITGEFGRTPRINATAGRDHWSQLSTLALAGGGLPLGQVYGESSAKAETPRSKPVSPQDLMATVCHVMGIDHRAQFKDPTGRPAYIVETGKIIEGIL
ncbi:MAG TPA: DUF1501 domain-containing protein [Gemmatales bacterium]|nr:DUF1501 domain-containing protein [Gemmatales bacterium]